MNLVFLWINLTRSDTVHNIGYNVVFRTTGEQTDRRTTPSRKARLRWGFKI